MLFSPEYETQKQIYAEGITSFVNQIRREFDEHLRDDQRIDLLSIIAAVVVGGISLLAWSSAARGVRRWRAQLLDSFHRHAEAEENLRKAHAELEVRVKERTAELAKANEALQAENTERKRKEELQWKTALLEAQVNASIDGILVVDHSGKKVLQNQRAADLLGIPQHIADDDDDDKQLRWVTSVIKNSEQFIEKVVYLNAHPNEISRDEIELKDGTILDRYSSPVVGTDGKYYGRIWTFRDITERKRAEAQRERLADIVEASPDFIGYADPKTTQIQYINKHGRRMCGIGEDEDVGKLKISDVHPAWMNKRFAEVILPAAVRDGLWEGEGAFLHRNGREIPVSMALLARKAANGEVDIFYTVSRDITERKQAEGLLRASEERYRSLFEANPLPMWIYDLETLSFLEINDAAISHYGYRREEFLSMTIADIRPTADKPALLANIAHATDHAIDNAGVWRHRKKDGSMIDVEITSHVLDYGGRRAELVLAFDITERKAAEKALQEAEAKYRSIFEHSNDGIFQNTPDGRHLSVNPALARMLGFDSPEELIRERDDIGQQAYADPEMHKKFKQTLEENSSIKGFEYEVYRKDGAKIWISENARIVRDAEGRALYYEGSVQDITERKRAEAERNVISEIVQGVITTSNIGELLELARRAIGKILYAENCFVALHDPRTDLLDFELWVDKLDPLPLPQPVGDGVSGSSYVLRTGRPLLLTNELKTQLDNEGEVRLIGTDSPSWLGVPLRTRSRTIGVLAVQHYEKEGAYSQRDVGFLSLVGDQIALAIERKLADEKLKRSEERLAAAQKMAHVGSWEWDVITNEVVWSDEEYRLFGLEPGEHEATHQFLLSLVHPRARRDAMRWFNAVRGMKKSSRMDIPIIRADGEERILNSWADVVLDDAGNVLRVVGASQDVTEQEKAERALGESEERFQLVSRATNDAIWDWDVIANSISFSESFGTLFGYRAGEFESTLEFWIQRIHPDDRDQVRESVSRVFGGEEESWVSEYRFLCADGSYAFVYDRGYVVRNAESKPQRMVGAMMNMTERKRAEVNYATRRKSGKRRSCQSREERVPREHEPRNPHADERSHGYDRLAARYGFDRATA